MPVALPKSRPKAPIVKGKAEYDKPLTAAAVLVVDDKTDIVLYKKNADEVRALASISKLASALALMDLSPQWSSTTVVSAADVDSSSHHLAVGEKYTLENLWHIALVGSSNSALNALVRASGLTEEQFVKKVNEKMKFLGCNSLRFADPTGLDERNRGNAWDVVKLLKNALKEDRIYKALGESEYEVEPLNKNIKHRIWTTNWLLTNWIPNKFDKEALAGKTGYIGASGYNFTAKIPARHGQALRIAIMGAASNEARFSETRDLAEWILANYLWPDDPGYEALLPR